MQSVEHYEGPTQNFYNQIALLWQYILLNVRALNLSINENNQGDYFFHLASIVIHKQNLKIFVTKPVDEFFVMSIARRSLAKFSTWSLSHSDKRTFCNMFNISKVKGKIVYSLGSSQQDSTIKYLKGAGAIIVSDKMTHVAFPTYLSATDINTTYAAQVEKYINSTK
ncbi:hypothetical protein RND71_031116 [Anisodus tanguticus]|uniref:Uncharacterized protein n=1 Tax=Anisodus tanguticus TaxID=243964 RepID=A0AAE1RAP8_9SOLA|nr:hypothetical protein RND71_031116 [Anisodus tanguticus]